MQSSTSVAPKFDEKLLELSSRIDEFEGYAHAHGLRIAEIADSIGRHFGMAEHEREVMQHACLVHDLGELVMGREYIRENRPLTEIERLDMQRHCVIGEQECSKRGLSRGIQLLVRWHHEWWNGNGYPDRLHGEQIPFAARIIRVADSFAALTENRPRRSARPDAEAELYLRDWAGLEFDPRIVKAFFQIRHSGTLDQK